jgi:hypothetical protein
MANTVSILSYTNTFGDLLTQQNKAAVELNNLGTYNYTKDSGTLYINTTDTALSVIGTSILGTTIVANTLAVSKDSTFLANVFLNGAGTTLVVSNNANIIKTAQANTVTANTLTSFGTTLNVTPPLVYMTSANLTATNTNASFNSLQLGGSLQVGTDITVANSIFVNGTNTSLYVSSSASVSNTVQANTIVANTITGFGSTLTVSPTTLVVTSPTLTATDTVASFNTISTSGSLQVGGNFVLTGSTVYATNNFTVGAGLAVNGNAKFATYRPVGSNAEIRWNETSKYYDLNDVNNGNYYRILTDEFVSDSTYNNGSTNVATSNAVSYLQGVANTANTRLNSIETINVNQNTNITAVNSYSFSAYATANSAQANTVYTQGVDVSQNTRMTIIEGANATQNTRLNAIETINTNQNTSISIINGVDLTQNTNITATNGKMESAYAQANAANGLAGGAYGRANTSANSFAGTTGTATPSSGGVTFASGNGVTVSGSGSTLTINTPQNLRTTDSPTFNGLTLTSLTMSGTGTAATQTTTDSSTNIATTAFVKNVLNSSNTYSINTSGNAYNITQYTVNQSVGTGNNVQHNSLGIGTGASGTTGEILATNNITAYYSDMRLKNKLGNIDNALSKVMTLSGFYYEANETAQALGYEVKKEVGVSAQEVQAIMPEVVAPAPIDNQYLTVRYEKLVPLLIEAIKELNAKVDELQKKIG